MFNQLGIICRAQTADEAFKFWWDLLSTGAEEEQLDSRDGEVVGEFLNAITIINDPTRNFMSNPIRKMSVRYTVGELAWYLSGKKDLHSIGLITKAWERFSDDGQNVNSNYGYCIKEKYGFDQWEYVIDLLRKHPDSRQAVIHIKEPRNTPTKDVNCTVSLQFFIRDCKLYMTTYMRSNDLWMGFPFDVFQFTFMQMLMAMELGVDLGTYTHIAGSLHLYRRNYELGKKREEEAE